jgi:signal transduction histidine kinase
MNASSKRFLILTAIVFVALFAICFLNYWISVQAVDGLLRRELAIGADATALDISTAAVAAHNAAISELKRALLLNSAVSLALALAGSAILNRALHRRSRSLERVTEGAMAIAAGKFDQRLVTSSDDTRLFADSVNLLSARLREQLEREAESRQFNSFMRVAATLTHDLKNAINGLSLLVGNMEKFHEREDFRAEAMQALKDETAKLQKLVNRLSDPVNSMSGEHKRPESTDLVPLIQRVLKSVSGSEPCQIGNQLPATLVAIVNAERIEKVIENLVLNALEAMGREPGTLSLAGGSAGDDKVFFSVSDTGPGMTPEFQSKRLFHAFATTKPGGLGLGLYTCREVIKAHGGSIDVESRPNAGTTFRVVLPCAPIRVGANMDSTAREVNRPRAHHYPSAKT